MVIDNLHPRDRRALPHRPPLQVRLSSSPHARNASLTSAAQSMRPFETLLRGGSEQDQTKAISSITSPRTPALPMSTRTAPSPTKSCTTLQEPGQAPDYEWEILQHSGKLLIECPFEVPLGRINVNTDIRLPHWAEPARQNRLGGVVRPHGCLPTLAARTESSITRPPALQVIVSTQQFPLSHQTQGYVWAAQHLYPDLDIRGTCINAIYITKPKNGTTNLLSPVLAAACPPSISSAPITTTPPSASLNGSATASRSSRISRTA